MFSCTGEASLEEAGQAGQGSSDTSCKQGMMATRTLPLLTLTPPMGYLSIYLSIITPKFNIPSSFDVQLGRVSFVGKKDFVLVHALHAVQCAQGRDPSGGGLFCSRCVCGFGGEQ